MSYRIGVDTGGTFTDLVVSGDDNRVLTVAKAPSTPAEPDQAVYNALESAAETLGIALSELLRRCNTFVHGNTVATNILIEQKGARTALLCTEGFRDTLAIRRGRRQQLWNLQEPRLRDLVPRYLRLGVHERTDRHGHIEHAPDTAELAHAAATFEREEVEAVAICFFNAYANSTNEELAAKYLAQRMPDCHVSVSSRLVPLIGEYERTSTTVIDAYVAPPTVSYLNRLRDRLQELGLKPGRLMMAQSNGGLVDVAGCIQRPALTLLSGPSAASSAARLYMDAAESKDLVVFDMGGTTCDVTLLRGGETVRRDTTSIAGYECALPSIDVHTIGAGGGTIARVEQGAMLRVGPESAGADPGPACYGKGSNQPTVTDANLVLGRLDPERFAQGKLPLDRERAVTAIEEAVAKPLGMSTEDAALGIIALADQHMIEAIRLMTVERGTDPRELVLVAAGGAGGLHAGQLGRSLGVKRTYIPRQAANFCAVGLMQSAVEQNWFQALIADLDQLDPGQLLDVTTNLRDRAEKELRQRQIELVDAHWHCSAALRVEGHQETILVQIPDPSSNDCIEKLSRQFHDRHELLYGFQRPQSQLEISHLQLSVIIPTPGLKLEQMALEPDRMPSAERRRLTVAPGKFDEVAICDSDSLRPGARISGPVLIHDLMTTVLALPGQSLYVDGFNNYVLEEEST